VLLGFEALAFSLGLRTLLRSEACLLFFFAAERHLSLHFGQALGLAFWVGFLFLLQSHSGFGASALGGDAIGFTLLGQLDLAQATCFRSGGAVLRHLLRELLALAIELLAGAIKSSGERPAHGLHALKEARTRSRRVDKFFVSIAFEAGVADGGLNRL
jgi:hypothetical protein